MLNSVEYLDFQQKKWILKESMNSARTLLSATAVGEYIYAFGGFTVGYAKPDNLLERYSIQNDVWEILDFQQNISFLGGAIINRTFDGQILILGGVNPTSQIPEERIQSLHLYNPENGEAQELNAKGLSIPNPKCITTNGVVYNCIGGQEKHIFLEYNLQYNQW